MSGIEQEAEGVIAEAAYQFVSNEIGRIEAAMPARLNAAEQAIQDWGHDAVNALHRVAAFIDQHRQGASATPAAAAPPAAPKAVGGPVPATATPVIVGNGTPETVIPATPPTTEAAK